MEITEKEKKLILKLRKEKEDSVKSDSFVNLVNELRDKADKAESTLTTANQLAKLYENEVSSVEKKTDILLKQDDAQLKNVFQKRLLEMTQNCVSAVIETEQDITTKISNLSNNEKAKSASTTIAAIIIKQIIKDKSLNEIDSVFLTASGGPFLKKRENSYLRSSIAKVTNHPKWNMGGKISVDSATMCNKIFELIEAHVLFNIPIDKLKIKIHEESHIHSAVIFKNGLVHMIMHDTTMIIPIRNSLFDNKFNNQSNNFFKSKKNIQLNFDEIKLSKFKILKTGYKVLKLGHTAWILFNVINDNLVEKFLNKKIFFYEIVTNLIKIFSQKKIMLYCKKTKVNNMSDIKKIINYGNVIVDKL